MFGLFAKEKKESLDKGLEKTKDSFFIGFDFTTKSIYRILVFIRLLIINFTAWRILT